MEFNPGGTWNQTTGSKFTFSAKYYNCIVGKKKNSKCTNDKYKYFLALLEE